MTHHLSRRDFLKAAGLFSLAGLPIIHAIERLAGEPAGASQPNVLIVTFDALSAFNMSLYGYPRQTTPNIERLARRATVFHNHYAGGNATTPGTSTLLTGTLPWTHHGCNLLGLVADSAVPYNLFGAVPGNVYTSAYTHSLIVLKLLYQFRESLAELVLPRELAFADLQYADRLFMEDYNAAYAGENIILRGDDDTSSSLFLSLLFRLFAQQHAGAIDAANHDAFRKGVPNQDYVYFNLENAIDWTIQQARALPRPFLSYYHFLPPHDPYLPRRDFTGHFVDSYEPLEKPESFAAEGFDYGQLKRNRLVYDRFIAYVDAEFGRLMDALEKSGVLEDTYVILTSDHGELFERGIRGHVTPVLYEPLVRIPLVISVPGVGERRDIYDPTCAVDILPTIAHLYGQPPPVWSEGVILPGFSPNPADPQRPVFVMDSKSAPRYGPMTDGSFTIIQEGYKLIHYIREPAEPDELYDLENDPDELVNLVDQQPERADYLRSLIQQKLFAANAPYLKK
jgi:arylsulfatase A-like enzyme